MTDRLFLDSLAAFDRLSDLLGLADRLVTRARRTRLTQQDRWDAVEEVELAYMFFMRDAPDKSVQWWGAMLVRMVMEYLLDNGRFRRDDFEAARAMLLKLKQNWLAYHIERKTPNARLSTDEHLEHGITRKRAVGGRPTYLG